jgi:hypothetical protein
VQKFSLAFLNQTGPKKVVLRAISGFLKPPGGYAQIYRRLKKNYL